MPRDPSVIPGESGSPTIPGETPAKEIEAAGETEVQRQSRESHAAFDDAMTRMT